MDLPKISECIEQDRCIIRADSKAFTLRFTVGSTSTPMDLTGHTVYFTLKKAYSDPDSEALIEKTVTTHTDPANGISTISLTPTETNIPLRDYYYDFRLKTPTGNVYTIIRGKMKVSYDVTKRSL